jgi:hypothetical protein
VTEWGEWEWRAEPDPWDELVRVWSERLLADLLAPVSGLTNAVLNFDGGRTYTASWLTDGPSIDRIEVRITDL